ncbi:MAG: Ig-like domain-containing protein, partial [Candidatus Nanoarchaeia archaeon]
MRTSTYTTTYGDAGKYSVIVRAKDKNHETTKTIDIVVEKKNREPVIAELGTIEVMETEKVQVVPEVSDPDKDKITLEFSEPLGADGSWTPEYGDRGEYDVTVTASDGQADVEQEFKLIVLKKNRAPVLKEIAPIEVFEGDKIEIPVQAYDPDGDDITITYTGWMDVGEYTTTYDDAYPEGCNTKGCTATYYVDVKV